MVTQPPFRHRSETASETKIVQGVPLQRFLRDQNLARLDLLKLDIEGAELDVFDSCPMSVLQEIPQITVELHVFLEPAQRAHVLDIIARMRKAGFHVLDFSRSLMNVLFLNEAIHPVSALDRMRMVATKYTTGVQRVLARQHG